MHGIKRKYISLFFSLLLCLSFTVPVQAANTGYKLTGNGANDIVSVAYAQKGLGGASGGSTFGFPQYNAWCAYFVCWAGRTAKANFPQNNLGTPKDVAKWFVNNNAGTFYYFRDANYRSMGNVKNKNLCVKSNRASFEPKKGDLICYLWSEDARDGYNWSHIGIVTQDYNGKGTVSTIEGNSGNVTNAYNGTVGTFARKYDSRVVGFIRPNYSDASTSRPQYTNCKVEFNVSSVSLDLEKNSQQSATLTISGDLPKGCKLQPRMKDDSIASVDWGGTSIGRVSQPIITAKAVGQTTLTCELTDANGKVLARAILQIQVTASEPVKDNTQPTQDANQAQSGQTGTAEQPKPEEGNAQSERPSYVPAVAEEWNGHYYCLYNNGQSTWEDAEAFCNSIKGHLATITSEEENAFIYRYMKQCGYQSAYFGLKNMQNQWTWCTGEAVSYTNWAPGEPNNQGGTEIYGVFSYKQEDGTWNDGDFRSGTGNGVVFLCEWDG